MKKELCYAELAEVVIFMNTLENEHLQHSKFEVDMSVKIAIPFLDM